MTTQKYFTDVFPGQDRRTITFFPQQSVMQMQLKYPNKRIWIEVQIPDDHELWPENYIGVQTQARVLEVQEPV